jgi:type IV secretory pathway protease TraF
MINKEILYEDAKREDHRVVINGKIVEFSVKKESGQAVFELSDNKVSLEPHEQHYLIDEMHSISIDFLSRRAFGAFSPAKKKPLKLQTHGSKI